MQLIRRLSFQNKIMLVTLVMILFVVMTGAIAIERLILPAIERDLQAEAWRVTNGVLGQLGSITAGDFKTQAVARLSTVFQVRAKLLYVELLDKSNEIVFRMGTEIDGDRGEGSLLEDRAESRLYSQKSASGEPFYETVSRTKSELFAATPLTVRVGFSARSLQDLSKQLFKLLFTLTFILLAVSFFVTRWFTSMIILPVNQLLQMSRSLASGHLEDVLKEVEEKLPCCQAVQKGYTGEEAKHEFCPQCPHCPLMIDREGLGPDLGVSAYPQACEECKVSHISGKDELSRLLLAFQCMAAGIRSYQYRLQQRFEFEQRLLDACPDGIIANDRQGRIMLFNKGAERLLGYEPGEVLQAISVGQIYPLKEAQAVKQALLSDDYGGPGILLDYSTQAIRKDGRFIPIRLSAAILYEKSEELAVVGFFHDLTELRQYTDALVEANKSLDGANKELSRLNRHYMEMLSFVTHELKSPVANAFMSANALKQGIFGGLSPDQDFMVDAICRNLTQSMEMIRHYLDLSRIERDELPIEQRPTLIFLEVIDPVLKGMGSAIQEARASIEVDVPKDLEWTLDPELFRGVFTNLVGNALKYGEEEGRIRIVVKGAAGGLRMEVWNSGPGIRKEDRHKLFQRFQRLQSPRQASTRGTGLGLFITKTIVERHGGVIQSESTEGEGVHFIIELPPVST